MSVDSIWQAMPTRNVTDSRIIRALAHPLRVAALTLLDENTLSPKELADQLGVPLPLASYHVRRLHQLDLIELVDTKQRRGALQHFYRARQRPTISDEEWAQVPAIVKRELISATLAQTNAEVASAAAVGGFDREDIHASRTSFRTDEEGWRETAELLAETLGRIEEIQQRAEARLATRGADHDDSGILRASAVMMLFEGPAPAFGEDVPEPADGPGVAQLHHS
jgi:DNA-binding transcriptional ArsR family regulator